MEALLSSRVAECASEVAVGEAGWENAAASSLGAHGFVVLRRPAGILPAPLLERCRRSASSRLQSLLSRLRAVGIEPESETFKYSEVCKRHSGGRFDLALRPEDDGWDELASQTEAWVLPVLRRAGLMEEGGGRDRVGCVCAWPGTPAQGFHVDGTEHGLVNAFVPLVDVDDKNGTEVEPGCACPAPHCSISYMCARSSQPCFDTRAHQCAVFRPSPHQHIIRSTLRLCHCRCHHRWFQKLQPEASCSLTTEHAIGALPTKPMSRGHWAMLSLPHARASGTPISQRTGF